MNKEIVHVIVGHIRPGTRNVYALLSVSGRYRVYWLQQQALLRDWKKVRPDE